MEFIKEQININEENDKNILLKLSQELLDSISNKNWKTYTDLCEESFTAIEPETDYTLCEGYDFHKTYFDSINNINIKIKENILSPKIQIINDTAIVTYKRIRQIINNSDKTVSTDNYTETRIWKKSNNWRLIHYHKTKL